jgi:hypothetical protein
MKNKKSERRILKFLISYPRKGIVRIKKDIESEAETAVFFLY